MSNSCLKSFSRVPLQFAYGKNSLSKLTKPCMILLLSPPFWPPFLLFFPLLLFSSQIGHLSVPGRGRDLSHLHAHAVSSSWNTLFSVLPKAGYFFMCYLKCHFSRKSFPVTRYINRHPPHNLPLLFWVSSQFEVNIYWFSLSVSASLMLKRLGFIDWE